jgi:hypothetical protein
MNTVFSKSNLYEILPTLYGDMAVFGTGAMLAEEDFDQVVRFYSIPVGSYCIANDSRGRATVFLRNFRMTVRQLVDKFGKGDIKATTPSGKPVFTTMVQDAYMKGEMETWVDVVHFIQPNAEYDQGKALSKYKKFSSCYYERAVNDRNVPMNDEGFLRESGYDNFPVFVTRWETTGEDVYGTNSPGMVALGDIKALQLMHRRKAQAIEKMVNPPLQAPEAMRTQKLTILPGEVNYVDAREGMQGIRPVHDVNFKLNELAADITAHQNRIREAFFADLFLMMSNDDRNQRATATEVNERREEKLLALGPVLEQLNQDLLDPVIDLVYLLMDLQGLIPPAPEDLQGNPLKVEYISIMAQAQKLVSVAGIERFQQFMAQQMQLDPNAMDGVDSTQMVASYGETTSVQPGIVRSAEQTAAIKAQKAEQARAEQMAAQAPAMAQAANSLANAPMDSNNALTQLMGQSQAGAIAPTR